MWRTSFALWLTIAACGSSSAEAAHVEPVSRPKATKPAAPVEVAGVSSRVDGAEMGDVASALGATLPDALSDADWRGITKEEHLKVTAAVETLRNDARAELTECTVQIALVDGSGNLLGVVRGSARVEGGPPASAERDALDAAARRAAKSAATAARAALHK